MSAACVEDFVIDQEFKDLIPPLSQDELLQLEENIKKDGCRDPLVVCDGVLIDGHNRYSICKKLGIDFKTTRMFFESRDEIKIWIIRNQFGRRNLALFTRTTLALALEPLIAKKAKANLVASGELFGKGSQNSADPIPAIETRKEIAKAANVSHDTVSKVKLINKANDAGEVPKQVIAKLHSGEVSINRVVRDIKETRTSKGREEQRKTAVAKTDPQFFDNVHIGDFRDNFDKVADGSLSLIFTDPPYDRKAKDQLIGLLTFDLNPDDPTMKMDIRRRSMPVSAPLFDKVYGSESCDHN